MVKRGVGFSVDDLHDPVKFNGSSGSSKQNTDRESVSAAAAAGHLVSSSSAVAHILGVILNNSPCCELIHALNL